MRPSTTCAFTSHAHIVFALLSLAGAQPDAAALWDMMSGQTQGAPVSGITHEGGERADRFTAPTGPYEEEAQC